MFINIFIFSHIFFGNYSFLVGRNGPNLYTLFAITAAGVVPCGGPKTSPRTSSIVQIILFFGPLRSIKIFSVFKILRSRNLLQSNVSIV